MCDSKNEDVYRFAKAPKDAFCDFHFKELASYSVIIIDDGEINSLDLCPMCYAKFLKNKGLVPESIY